MCMEFICSYCLCNFCHLCAKCFFVQTINKTKYKIESESVDKCADILGDTE